MDRHKFKQCSNKRHGGSCCGVDSCGLPPSADVHDMSDTCDGRKTAMTRIEIDRLVRNLRNAEWSSGTDEFKDGVSLSHEFVHPVPASASSGHGLDTSECELREAVLRVIDDGHWMLNSEDESSEESEHRLAFCDALVARLRETGWIQAADRRRCKCGHAPIDHNHMHLGCEFSGCVCEKWITA